LIKLTLWSLLWLLIVDNYITVNLFADFINTTYGANYFTDFTDASSVEDTQLA